MRMCYISHPYTGDEERNHEKSARIQAELQAKFQSKLFINPIANFAALKEMPYMQIMTYCLALLNRCDEVVFAGDYHESRGCMMELSVAKNNNLPIYSYVDGSMVPTVALGGGR